MFDENDNHTEPVISSVVKILEKIKSEHGDIRVECTIDGGDNAGSPDGFFYDEKNNRVVIAIP